MRREEMDKRKKLTTIDFLPLTFTIGWLIGNILNGWNKYTIDVILIMVLIQIIILAIHYS
jgi:hypothetical protein